MAIGESHTEEKKVAVEVKQETEELWESSKAMLEPAKRRWRAERREEYRAQEAQPHRPAGRLLKKRFASPVSWLPRPREEAASKVAPLTK